MQVYFWGTRGSLPVALEGDSIREKIRRALLKANGRRFENAAAAEQFIDELDFPVRSSYGGNSACVEIIGGDHYTLCDMGSGLRPFGQQVMRRHGTGQPQVYNFFMSHVHWDHIMGFPFFTPAYISGNVLRIYCGHPSTLIEDAFRRQQSSPCFPVEWNHLGATVEFIHLDADQWHEIDGLRVLPKRQPHPGDSYGYRFEQNDKAFIYSTDTEHKLTSDAETEAAVEFYRGADLVVLDAMYSLNEMINSKADWGHSSNVVGVDLCLRAGVKHYCLFHHDPVHGDETIHNILGETRRYAEIAGDGQALQVSAAYDGLLINV